MVEMWDRIAVMRIAGGLYRFCVGGAGKGCFGSRRVLYASLRRV